MGAVKNYCGEDNDGVGWSGYHGGPKAIVIASREKMPLNLDCGVDPYP